MACWPLACLAALGWGRSPSEESPGYGERLRCLASEITLLEDGSSAGMKGSLELWPGACMDGRLEQRTDQAVVGPHIEEPSELGMLEWDGHDKGSKEGIRFPLSSLVSASMVSYAHGYIM